MRLPVGEWKTLIAGGGYERTRPEAAQPLTLGPPSRHTPDMAFTVWLVSEGEFHPEECEDGDLYEFLTGGVLVMTLVEIPRVCSPKFPTRGRGQCNGSRVAAVARRRLSAAAWWSRSR